MNINIILVLLVAVLIGVLLGKLCAKVHKDDEKAIFGCYALSITGIVMIAMVFISFYNVKQHEYYGWITNMSFYKKSNGARSSSTVAMNLTMDIKTPKGRKEVTLKEDRPEFLDIMSRGGMFTVAQLYSPITKDTIYKIIENGASIDAIKYIARN